MRGEGSQHAFAAVILSQSINAARIEQRHAALWWLLNNIAAGSVPFQNVHDGCNAAAIWLCTSTQAAREGMTWSHGNTSQSPHDQLLVSSPDSHDRRCGAVMLRHSPRMPHTRCIAVLIYHLDHAHSAFVESRYCSTYSGTSHPRSLPRQRQAPTRQTRQAPPNLAQDASC